MMGAIAGDGDLARVGLASDCQKASMSFCKTWYRSLLVPFPLYAYDAYVLHCAWVFSCPLSTLDRRMKQVAAQRGIKLLV